MRHITKWGVSSVGGLVANLALLTVWVDGVGIDPVYAVLINFVLISAASYTLANWWIFADGVTPTTATGHAVQWAGMETGMFAGKLANYGIYILLLPITDYRIAWTVGAVVTFAVTFTLNKMWWQRTSQVSM